MTSAAESTCAGGVPEALSAFPEDEHTEPDLPWHLGVGASFVRARLRVQHQMAELRAALDIGSYLELELTSTELVGAARGLSVQHAALRRTAQCTPSALRGAQYEVRLVLHVAAALLAECAEFAYVNPRLRDLLIERNGLIRTALEQDVSPRVQR